jgi:ribonuclease H / adenosylcobalamin/alpha-ribazole phosphatase
MERALLVRHAESVFSARGIANGEVDVRCPLSRRGVAQARALARDIADEDIDLCVTSELERTRQTADVALADRAIPRIVLSDLNDPLYGRYESGPLDAYIAWALANDSAAEPPGGGEQRQKLVARYAAGFRKLVERPERTLLIVTHSLPVAYVLMALAGHDPAPRVPLIEYAKVHAISGPELADAVARLERWCAAPTW